MTMMMTMTTMMTMMMIKLGKSPVFLILVLKYAKFGVILIA